MDQESRHTAPPTASRASPRPQVDTQNINRGPRFSYMATPAEAQRPTFQQQPKAQWQPPSPTNSDIQESPLTAGTQATYQAFPNDSAPSSYPVEKAPIERTESPYNFPPPHEVHPAHFAPLAEHQSQPKHQSHAPAQQLLAPSTIRNDKTGGDQKLPPGSRPAVPLVPDHDPFAARGPGRSHVEPKTPMYHPDSLAGPNAAADAHRPGQVGHPNSSVNPQWKHGLCEVDTTCCIGVVCPCMIYGKTQYRLSQKAKKRDGTDLLGYDACNGSCALMAVACGFQWIFAAIQHTRIRKLYNLDGSFGSDCLTSLCCCCCVLMQDEREVRDREESLQRHAGPVTGPYISPGSMTYAPPPR